MVKERSFWTTTSGVVTGVAGTLTGVVGIATVAAQLGWIGPSDGNGESASPTNEAGATTSADDAGGDRTSGSPGTRASRQGTDPGPTFSVDPSSVSFTALGERTAAVGVRNTGDVDLTVEGITVEGEDDERFSVSAAPCTRSTLAPGRSCEVEVSFSPGGGGEAKATMVVEVADARQQEVPLSASSLL